MAYVYRYWFLDHTMQATEYLETYGVEDVLRRAVAAVVKERPADPIRAISAFCLAHAAAGQHNDALDLSTPKVELKSGALVRLPASLSASVASLTHLDVGGNRGLTTLDGIETLCNLRVLFCPSCGLGPRLPAGGPLSTLPSLFMLGLKDNGLRELDGAALPSSLVWLIAPQNDIGTVLHPGRLGGVRKLMLSHNRLTTEGVAATIAAIPSLEMLRVACNALEAPPGTAFAHPKLAWLAIGGNPYSNRCAEAALEVAGTDGSGAVRLPDASEVVVSDVELGRGSGAVVRRGTWGDRRVAVKIWSEEKFSDGDARGEWTMGRLTGGCPTIVATLAAWDQPSLGMCSQLLEGASAVGGPPNFDSVTRDTFSAGKHARLAPLRAAHVARTVAQACAWLHQRGLMHGDVYLHNTLRIPSPSTVAADIVHLSDLGAASAYDRSAHGMLEKLEVRSFGYLVLDLLHNLAPDDDGGSPDGGTVVQGLAKLAERCIGTDCSALPAFVELVSILTKAPFL